MTAPAPLRSMLPQALVRALGAVQREHGRQRRLAALRRGLGVAALALLVLGLARALNLALLTLPVAVLVALGGGLLTGVLLMRTPAMTVLDAARLSDRRAELGGLLTTALTLPGLFSEPGPSEPVLSSPQTWAAALRGRVLAQAGAAAASVYPAQIVPAAPLRVWSWPAGLLGLALLAWLVPPLPARAVVVSVPPAAVVEDTVPAQAPAAAGPAADISGAPIVNEPEPLAQPQVAQTTGRGSPRASGAPVSDAASGQGRGKAAATPGMSAARASQAARPREARQTVGAGVQGAATSSPSGGGKNNQDTPFGSRESGDFQNQSVTNPDRLASAPYDPATAPGATPVQQKADPGSSGLRSASGGRGIESEGADKCVEGCLTNDDMNRGAQPAPSRPRAPGGETASGTSDSGSGAAGGSSGVGLGVGTLKPFQSRTQIDLGGDSGEGTDRLQVLAAPRQDRGTLTDTPPSQTQDAAWAQSAEAPTTSTSIPEAARATVRAYFERTQP